ncbi:MAG TPA: Ig-like domain-containing protein [Anaerolineaceae bacterium]|nr:Ig-like domain-containing protein [Anaerolineaceae bacterium]HPN50520.1 Ig-like domain-containing protein [Anaerolineaceae bacterium]
MKKALLAMLLFILLMVAGALTLPAVLQPAAAAAPSPTPAPNPEVEAALTEAAQELAAQRMDVMRFAIYGTRVNHITYSDDGKSALVWLESVDLQNGKVMGSEPILVIATLDASAKGLAPAEWKLTLQTDPGFMQAMENLPEELHTEPMVDRFESASQLDQIKAPNITLGGYYLPWAAGLAKDLEWSVAHASCYNNECKYAFDFCDGTMFPLLAAKGGTVFWYNDECPNGSESCTNRLVLEDRSTTPISYQVYYHLAQNSIPAELKTIGAPVRQGQFIGNVDDTGYSTNHHLHFMVHTTYGLRWGPSVDITFKDVFINWDEATQGGRPRMKSEAAWYGGEGQDVYVSGNVGTNPPTGELLLPAPNQTITAPFITGGWASDDRGIARIQLIANYDGAWREIGPAAAGTPFAYEVDLCSTTVPDGPFTLALKVWDVEGNMTFPIGARQMVKDTPCKNTPPPTCNPTSNQVAIYSEPNYGGVCKLLEIGSYPLSNLLSPLGDNTISSIKVGSNVQAVVYDEVNYGGRTETIAALERSLDDNRIGSDTISSIKVKKRSDTPSNPELTLATGSGGGSPSSLDSLVLGWNGGGATKYQAELYQGSISGSPYMTRTFGVDTFWSIGSLPAGSYAWRVQGRIVDASSTQHFSEWQTQSFTVTANTLPPSGALNLPIYETAESGANGWVASGFWQQAADPANSANHVWEFGGAGGYGTGLVARGDLTSPPVTIPATSTAYLRFKYRSETETTYTHWDQRWVQISRNGGPFTNLVQLTYDPQNEWISSPPINLSAYAGSTIRIRFHFDTVDDNYNAFYGWLVDDIAIDTNAPETCTAESPSNNTFNSATVTAIGKTVIGAICPAGDLDYYTFSATAGDKLSIDVDAQTLDPVSLLNSRVYLYQGSDNLSVIAENDDEMPGLLVDPFLGFTIPTTGTYTLRLQAHNPGDGGADYFYKMTLRKDTGSSSDLTDPTVSFISPVQGSATNASNLTLNVAAADSGSGMSRVEFWMHNADWTNGKWTLIDTDWNGSNGWQTSVDISGVAEGQKLAFMARAYDRSENTAVAVNWSVVIDRTSPVVSFVNPPASFDSTAIRLDWHAQEASSGIAHFTLQVNVDGGGWQALPQPYNGGTRRTFFIGEWNRTYAFRLQAMDNAGNLSNVAETSTAISGGCQGDAYEANLDDEQANATPLENGVSQAHNFCGSGDRDWVTFTGQAGVPVLISALPDDLSAAAAIIRVYAHGDSTVLAEAAAPGLTLPATLMFIPPADGAYDVSFKSIDPNTAGTDVTYRLRVGPGYWIYFPVIFK